MFTGIIEEPRPVTGVRRRVDGGLDVDLDLGGIRNELAPGDSIAVAGACLTVARMQDSIVTFELSPETIARTHFHQLRVGANVNIERALRVGDRLGGHWVQGHVDGVASVARLEQMGEWAELDIALPPALARYCVEKGSICLDGVSLTIARIGARPDGGALITIALIPHTLVRTTLGGCVAGSPIHVEVDVLAKYVERLAAPWRDAGGSSKF
ncbi:MAG: riboflavin synthase [Planctomycetes bacterium]|nr:riboflavin synthase [Planctomycetota bacterium]